MAEQDVPELIVPTEHETWCDLGRHDHCLGFEGEMSNWCTCSCHD